ncbi:tigger transposable element-derived protein 4-like [Ischnura elegans]|uniref:tigger transposable element-derived protein 4-like n=1 Tax=Ischnura elegans TaxID=197161 RepID=UPI001ED89FA0|nr:tigger transposable element-derived protein 4-like [Ischnura elegans]
MTSHLLQEQMQALDAKMGVQNRKIVVFLDQCPAHPKNMNLRNIKLVFFPPNCTSQLQPLDLGIIHVSKSNYRRILVRKAINLIDSGRDPKSFKVSVLDALLYVERPWKEVVEGKIANCFKKAGFSFSEDCNLEQDGEESLEEGRGGNIALGADDQLPLFGDEITFSDFVGVDELLSTCKSLTIDEAIDLHDSDETASEEDDDDTEMPKESTINAMSAVSALRQHLSTVAGNEKELELLDIIEKRVEIICTNKMTKQTKIMEYFEKKAR